MGRQRNKGQRSKEDNGIIEYTEDTTKIRTLQFIIIDNLLSVLVAKMVAV